MQEYTVVSHDIPLGHRWEHHAWRIRFDISQWVKDFGAGGVELLHQRQEDAYPYPVTVTRTDADGETVNDTTGTLVFWDVTSTDTAQVCRYGKAELRYYRGTQVSPEFLAKSDIYRTTVENALGGALATAPEETPDWLATLLDAANSIDDRVSGAVSDARGYADAAQGYAQAAQQANANAAQEARTYAANAAQSATDARQAARDAASNVAGYVSDARSAANDAANSAQDAADYVADTQSRLENTEFLMGKFLTMDVSAQSLPSTSAASAQFGVSGDSPENLTISMRFGIPRGADGVSVTDMTQTVTSSESGGVNTVTVTLSDGTTRSFHVTNGARGDTGEPFRIAKTYASVAAMNADAASVTPGAFVVIASDTEDPDNAKLYVRGENGFVFLTDLSGARGIQGPAGADGVSVSTVTHTTDASGNIVVTLTLSNGNSSTFTIPKGDTGATGPQGPKGDTGTFSAEDLRRITALESENALLRELVNGIDAPIYREASGNPVTFSDGYPANVKALSVEITPSQSGTGDPSPTNVRPISGVSSVGVTRTGKNLLELVPAQITGSTLFALQADGTFLFSGAPESSVFKELRPRGTFPLYLPQGDYILSGVENVSVTSGRVAVYCYRVVDGQASGESYYSNSNSDETRNGVSFHSDGDYWSINLMASAGTYANVPVNPMIRLASAPGGYEQYDGQSATVSLVDSNSDPLTVYGGTLNVTTGELSVTHKTVELPTSNWYTENGNRFTHANIITGIKPVPNITTTIAAVCSHYKASDQNTTWESRLNVFSGTNGGTIYIVDTRFSTAEDFMAWLAENETPVQVCYELATPVTHTLTPAQLATLSGYNSVTTDAGTLSVTYRADTKMSLGGD